MCMYPGEQLQKNDPFVLMQNWSHGPSPPLGAHSLMSVVIDRHIIASYLINYIYSLFIKIIVQNYPLLIDSRTEWFL